MNKKFDFLKKRAKEFFERAEEDYEKKRYNLYVFDIEQTLQLWFKYLIYVKTGEFPKTHEFEILIKELKEIYNLPEIYDFYKEHILEFRVLEDSYITSRYIPKEFNEEECKKIKEFAKKVLEFMKEKLNEELVQNFV